MASWLISILGRCFWPKPKVPIVDLVVPAKPDEIACLVCEEPVALPMAILDGNRLRSAVGRCSSCGTVWECKLEWCADEYGSAGSRGPQSDGLRAS